MDQLNNLIALSDEYFNLVNAIQKLSYIRKLPNGKYRVFSEKGKNLGTFESKEKAEKRLKQVEYFKFLDSKKKKASKNEIDLTDINDFSYSAIMRELRKQCDSNVVKQFLNFYKLCFDSLVNNEIDDAAEKALDNAVKLFSCFHPIKLNLNKKANASYLGNAALVGKYLADIIKFTLNRISPESRPKSIDNLKRKLYLLNETELANKKMPASSSMGQAITFVKHVLLAHDPVYIRDVLNNIVRYLG